MQANPTQRQQLTKGVATLTVVRPAVTLVAQAMPVAAISTAYCEPHVLSFSVHLTQHGLQQANVAFQHTHTGALKFMVKGGIFSKRKTLVNGTHIPIANFKEKLLLRKRTTHVHAGRKPHGEPLLQIAADYLNGNSTAVHVAFRDAATGEHCEVGFEGNWQHRDAQLWLDRGHSGVRETVAKIHGRQGTAYRVDVASNMDAALVVIICAVLQRAECKYNYVEHTNAMTW